jgi:hypothetical protein
MALTEKQMKFLSLEKRKEEVKKFFDELKQANEELAAEIGIGGMFQDPSDGTVFKMVIPEGKFVNFDKVGYVRTKREGEERGTLAAKAAEEAGYSLPEKRKK